MLEVAAAWMADLTVGIHSMTQAVETLSGGQRQCVAVVRAAAFARQVVILDEPTAALGVKEGRLVLDLIRRVHDKGLSVILVSHNMPHVFAIADRIHVARLGRRVALLNPKTISMSDTVAVMTGATAPENVPAARSEKPSMLGKQEEQMNRPSLPAAIAAALTVGPWHSQPPRRCRSTTSASSISTSSCPTPRPQRGSLTDLQGATASAARARHTALFVVLGDVPADRQVGCVAMAPLDRGSRRFAATACSRRSTIEPAWPARCRRGLSVAAAGPTGMWPNPDELDCRFSAAGRAGDGGSAVAARGPARRPPHAVASIT